MAYIKPDLQSNQFIIYAIRRSKNTTFIPHMENDHVVENDPVITIEKYENTYIPITFFDGKLSSNFATYDEQLVVKENSQYTLTFSVIKYLNHEINPFFYLMVENRRLRLQTYDKKIDFIITSISPETTNNNVVYKVTCQDVFSYDMSKQNVNLNFKIETPKDIASISNFILQNSKMDRKWQTDPKLENGYYADFPSLQKARAGNFLTTHRMKTTFEITNSTIYNAFVELCKKFNANLEIQYSDEEGEPGIINFSNKIKNNFTGYILRPEVNLSSFSVSRSTDNFCSIMHVSGGEDGDGAPVMMMPKIPLDLQKYFIMLYPMQIERDQLANYAKTVSYKYFVNTSFKDNKQVTYTLYKKVGDTDNFQEFEYNYIPWTTMSSEDIEKNFYSFADSNTTLFSNPYSVDVKEYFNFLCYRAKSASSMFYNFDYYLKAGIMDDETYAEIENIFSVQLRNLNIVIACLSEQYYNLSRKLLNYESIEEEDIAKLAALDEESFTYALSPEDKPKRVLSVAKQNNSQMADAGTLNPTTIELMIDNQRNTVIQDLLTNVWTEDFYKTFFTLNGIDGFDNKMNNIQQQLDKQKSIYKENYEAAVNLLNQVAPAGSILVIKSTPLSAGETTEQIVAPVQGSNNYCDIRRNNLGDYYIYINVPKEGAGMAKVDTITYKGAVLNQYPTLEEKIAWNDSWGDGLSFAIMNFPNDQKTFHLEVMTRTGITSKVGSKLVFAPVVGTSIEDRASFLSDKDQMAYTSYAVYQKKYQSALQYIEESKMYNDKIYTRKGLYAMYLYYLKLMTEDKNGSFGFQEAKQRYKTPINLVEWLKQMRIQQSQLWQDIYTNYNDYVAETSFADDKQISSDGLFMSAMQAFSKYNTPACNYSVSMINPTAILNIEEKSVEIGDLVYVQNKQVSSKYNGLLKITIPKRNIGDLYLIKGEDGGKIIYATPIEAKNYEVITRIPLNEIGLKKVQGTCKLYCRKNDATAYQYPYTEVIQADGTIKQYTIPLTIKDEKLLKIIKITTHDSVIDIYLKCPLEEAAMIIKNKANYDSLKMFTIYNKISNTSKGEVDTLKTDIDIYTNILNIEIGEDVDPIPLQITGVTQKLREGTSQLTVSTDRTMDIVFSRLMKQARL